MKRILSSFWLLVLISLPLRGQVYPVEAAVYLDASGFTSISDLGGFGNSIYPLQVHLLLRDLTVARREVNLEVSITGGGLQVGSASALTALPVTLEGGVGLTLGMEELTDLFQWHNLSGVGLQAYSEALPEGSYEICIKVLDHLTGKLLALPDCYGVFIYRNSPPLLLTPDRGAAIVATEPQTILFQWEPRHSTAQPVRYKFTLAEIWDTDLDPQTAFLAVPPIYSVETTGTSFLYDLEATPLIPDRRYAWRVQAGVEGEAGKGFTNNGFSEIYWFDYTSPCDPPAGVGHEVKGMYQANIVWEDNGIILPDFTVRFRKQGDGNQWFYRSTPYHQLTLWDLTPGTTYEYQVRRNCRLYASDHSLTRTFTTLTHQTSEDLVDCTIIPSVNLRGELPLAELRVNQEFTAGDFSVRVTEVSGKDGRFTGKGVVRMPVLGTIGIEVRFREVFINTYREMVKGMVVTTYDRQWTNMLDVDQLADEVEDLEDILAGGDVGIHHLPDEVLTTESIEVRDGKIIITTADGSVKEFDHDPEDTVIITDAGGRQWLVSGTGTVEPLGEGAPGGPVTDENTYGTVTTDDGNVEVEEYWNSAEEVLFYKGGGSKYALDTAGAVWQRQVYPFKLSGDKKVYPAHKAVVGGTEEVFYARIPSLDTELSEKLVVKTLEGRSIPAELTGVNGELKITLRGIPGYLEEEAILGYFPEEGEKFRVLAGFYIHHLRQIPPVNLVAVGCGDARVPDELAARLLKVFAPLGIEFNLKVSNGFQPDRQSWDILYPNGMLDYNGSGLMADYPEEFRRFSAAFRESALFEDKEAYHLFFLDESLSGNTPIAGFMPPGRPWGFIFSSGSSEQKADEVEVALHELGHGVFRLQHPEVPGSDEGLLMQEGAGDFLGYHAWQELSSTGLELHWFDPDSEKEIGGKTWFAPDWTPFRVADTRVISAEAIPGLPRGTVPGFRANNLYYMARIEDGQFTGYFNKEGQRYSLQAVTGLEDEDEVYFFRYAGGCGFNRCYKAKYGMVKVLLPDPDLDNTEVFTLVSRIPCEGESGVGGLMQQAVCGEAGSRAPSDEEMRQWKTQLEAAVVRRRNAGTGFLRPDNAFYHLLNMNEEETGEAEVLLEDKLFLLSSLGGIQVYVLPVDGRGKQALADPDRVAESLINAIPDLQDSPVVLVLLPYTGAMTSGEMYRCVNTGLAQSQPGILPVDGLGLTGGSSVYEWVMGMFSSLEKPYGLHRYFIRANGEILHLETKNGEGRGVRGLPWIFKAEFYRSPRLREIDAIVEEIDALEALEGEYGGSAYLSAQYRELRQERTGELNSLFKQAYAEEEATWLENNIDYWDRFSSELGRLREPLIGKMEYLNAWFGSSYNSPYLERWKILLARSSLEEDDFYDYDPWVVADDVIYTSLDLFALVPDPRVEMACEFTGLVYATLREDMVSAAMYNLALAIPFGKSGYLGALDNGAEATHYATFARLEGEDLALEVKTLSEAGASELQVTPILTADEGLATAIGEEGFTHIKGRETMRAILSASRESRQLANLLKVDWKGFPSCFQCENGAVKFWEDESEEMLHQLVEGYYLKHRESTGELLIGNLERKEVVAYFRGVENTAVIGEYSKEEILRVIRRYKGEGSTPVSVAINFSSGLKLVSDPERCTTVIGNYGTQGWGSGGDMKGLIEEILLNLKHSDFEGSPNGFNVLNVSDAMIRANEQFFEQVNKPWLQRAIDRGDVIAAATDPMDLGKVFLDSQIALEIDSIDLLKRELSNLNDAESQIYLTGFGKEVRLMFLNNYDYNASTKLFYQ